MIILLILPYFPDLATSKLGTRLPQLMNTSGFHQNVGEGNKLFNAMSPDSYLSEAFGKGSRCARLFTKRFAEIRVWGHCIERLVQMESGGRI